jgi:hypothetical protein
MSPSPTIRVQLRCPASAALQRISEATAEEGLPFLSPARPRDKAFLSRIDGAKFRLWKWPSGSRGNRLVPILHAEITDADGGSILTGSFRLHPFARFLPIFTALVMLGIAATIWIQGSGIRAAVFAIFCLLMSVASVLFAFQNQRPQTQEEEQIRKFLENVFADVR